MDDIKRKKRIIRLIFVFLNLSFVATVVDIFSVLFRSLNTDLFKAYNVSIFRISGLDVSVFIPAWPFILMIIEIIIGLICLKFLYRFICKYLKAEKY